MKNKKRKPGRPKRDVANGAFCARLPHDLLDELAERAASERRSQSAIIQLALERMFALPAGRS